MNATLTTCMIVSILAALAGAIGAFAAGWGLLAAFALYSLCGTVTLLASTALATGTAYST